MANHLVEADVAALLRPFFLPGTNIPARLYSRLSIYLELLLKWNARTNLSAIRDPVEIVRRHFGESLFAAQHLMECETLLDFGSGAGFPGLPIQLLRSDVHVTLAESQNKKATFLHEAVRSLGLKTAVWAGRVEAMPQAAKFDVVALRAVDNMAGAIATAAPRAERKIMLLTTFQASLPEIGGFTKEETIPIPNSKDRVLTFLSRRK